MIIKSHIRGGYRSAAEYMKEQGQNEKTRVVELSDPSAKNLDDATATKLTDQAIADMPKLGATKAKAA